MDTTQLRSGTDRELLDDEPLFSEPMEGLSVRARGGARALWRNDESGGVGGAGEEAPEARLVDRRGRLKDLSAAFKVETRGWEAVVDEMLEEDGRADE